MSVRGIQVYVRARMLYERATSVHALRVHVHTTNGRRQPPAAGQHTCRTVLSCCRHKRALTDTGTLARPHKCTHARMHARTHTWCHPHTAHQAHHTCAMSCMHVCGYAPRTCVHAWYRSTWKPCSCPPRYGHNSLPLPCMRACACVRMRLLCSYALIYRPCRCVYACSCVCACACMRGARNVCCACARAYMCVCARMHAVCAVYAHVRAGERAHRVDCSCCTVSRHDRIAIWYLYAHVRVCCVCRACHPLRAVRACVRYQISRKM